MSNRLLMGHSHLKMAWIESHLRQKDGTLLTYSPAPPLPPVIMSPYTGTGTGTGTFHKDSTSGTRISPAVLFVIVILAVLFFISGLLHLLVRFLIKHPSQSASQDNRYPDMSGSDAIQRQLQQLFHLHDSGLDQAFIDALPVFQYKEIVGLKEPFDCAVCLCEFSEKDKLRLLPMCSHAFHINCIDTWLLSNSTCPLCRGMLFAPGCSMENPMFDFDDFREEDLRHVSEEAGFGKAVEIEEVTVKKGILPVRLGKFRRLNDGAAPEAAGGETSSSNLDARRCFSMGSYQYVLAESDLRVALTKNQCGHNIKLPSQVEHNENPSTVDRDTEGKKISTISRGESFSVSKIWLWPKKGKFSTMSDAHTDIPTSLNAELPWISRTQQK